MPRLQEYLREDGASPYQAWFDSLDCGAAVQAAKATAKMALGHVGNMKSLQEGVHEYRIDYGPGYRIYVGLDGAALIILLGGGDKSRQDRDIAEAKRLWAEFKRRKEAQKVSRRTRRP